MSKGPVLWPLFIATGEAKQDLAQEELAETGNASAARCP
jgi:hypothetical protein